MDIASLVGLVGAIGAILAAMIAVGGDAPFIDTQSNIIVFGGTYKGYMMMKDHSSGPVSYTHLTLPTKA